MVAPCNATSDLVCACVEGLSFNSTGGLAPCSNCSACAPGYKAEEACTPEADTVCLAPCTAGLNFNEESGGIVPCGNCTVCPAHYATDHSCTPKSDTTCEFVPDIPMPAVWGIFCGIIIAAGVLIFFLWWQKELKNKPKTKLQLYEQRLRDEKEGRTTVHENDSVAKEPGLGHPHAATIAERSVREAAAAAAAAEALAPVVLRGRKSDREAHGRPSAAHAAQAPHALAHSHAHSHSHAHAKPSKFGEVVTDMPLPISMADAAAWGGEPSDLAEALAQAHLHPNPLALPLQAPASAPAPAALDSHTRRMVRVAAAAHAPLPLPLPLPPALPFSSSASSGPASALSPASASGTGSLEHGTGSALSPPEPPSSAVAFSAGSEQSGLLGVDDRDREPRQKAVHCAGKLAK